MFDDIADKTVKDAIAGLHERILDLETGPFGQAALSIAELVNKLSSNGLEITLKLKATP